MNTWYVWTKQDLGRGGSTWDPGASSPPDPVLDEIVNRWASPQRFAQLSTQNRASTDGIPIVSAGWEDTVNRWVFVLRGVGGRFRGAGTFQVTLAPSGMPLSEAWVSFFAAIKAEGIVLTHRLTEPAGRSAESSNPANIGDPGVDGTLLLLAQDAMLATVDADPTDTIDLFAAVLRVLPEDATRGVSWSTCHVPVEIRQDDRVLTGRWPESLVTTWPTIYNRLRVVPVKVSSLDVPPLPARMARTIAWVASGAAGRVLESHAKTVAEFLAEADARRPLTVDEVAEAARNGVITDDVAVRVATDGILSRGFATRHPALAFRVMESLAHQHPLRHRLLTIFVLAEPSEVSARVFESLRTEARSGSTSAPLGHALKDALAHEKLGHNQLVRAMRNAFPNRGDERELQRIEPWLTTLGITRDDMPELFAFDVGRAVELARAEKPELAREFIGSGPDWLERAARVFSRLGLAEPGAASLLLKLAGNIPDPSTVGHLLGEVRAPSSAEATRFIRELANLTNGDGASPEQRQELTAGIIVWCNAAKLNQEGPLSEAALSLATGHDARELFRSTTRRGRAAASSPAYASIAPRSDMTEARGTPFMLSSSPSGFNPWDAAPRRRWFSRRWQPRLPWLRRGPTRPASCREFQDQGQDQDQDQGRPSRRRRRLAASTQHGLGIRQEVRDVARRRTALWMWLVLLAIAISVVVVTLWLPR